MAVYLSRGQACARGNDRRKRGRKTTGLEFPSSHAIDEAFMFCLAGTVVKFFIQLVDHISSCFYSGCHRNHFCKWCVSQHLCFQLMERCPGEDLCGEMSLFH